MTTEKHEIDRIINEIIIHGNWCANRFRSNIGAFVDKINGGDFMPPSWPQFHENCFGEEFYRRDLTITYLHEWLEHLFRLKLGDAEWQPIESAPKGCKKLILGFFIGVILSRICFALAGEL